MEQTKKQALRQCVGCRQMKAKKDLIRIVRTEDGMFVPDRTGKKNGRGAYLCDDPECLKLAEKNKGLERSFKCAVPKEVYDSIRQDLKGEEKE